MADNMVANNPLEGRPAELSFAIQDVTEEMVSVIVVHHSRPSYLNLCLQSIAVCSLNSNYELIVVDNASEDQESIDFLNDLEEQGEVKVIRNKENKFWSVAANQGAKAADKKSKYLVFCHCDVVVTSSSWLDLMINVSESQGAGIVGVSLGRYQLDKQNIDFVEEFCMLVTRECFYDCNQFDERLPLIGASFILTLTAQRNNYRPQIIRNSIVHHYAISSFDISKYEQLGEQAMTTIPTLLREVQSRSPLKR